MKSLENNQYMFVSSLAAVSEGQRFDTREPHIPLVPLFEVDSIEAFRNAMINRLAERRRKSRPIEVQIGKEVCSRSVVVATNDFDSMHFVQDDKMKNLRVLTNDLETTIKEFGSVTQPFDSKEFVVVGQSDALVVGKSQTIDRVQLVRGSHEDIYNGHAEILNDWAIAGRPIS